jgi:hypothetical protein
MDNAGSVYFLALATLGGVFASPTQTYIEYIQYRSVVPKVAKAKRVDSVAIADSFAVEA